MTAKESNSEPMIQAAKPKPAARLMAATVTTQDIPVNGYARRIQ
jgi:hypothetical protein